jgi:hypothetical protein
MIPIPHSLGLVFEYLPPDVIPDSFYAFAQTFPGWTLSRLELNRPRLVSFPIRRLLSLSS